MVGQPGVHSTNWNKKNREKENIIFDDSANINCRNIAEIFLSFD